MRKFALICSLMLGMGLNAQYYWQWAGTADMDILHRGEASGVGPGLVARGQIMSGIRNVTGSPILGAAFNENASLYYFRNQYRIRPTSTSLAQHTANKNLMVEINSGSTAYGMCGSLLKSTGGYALYYFPVQSTGATNAGGTNGWIYDPGSAGSSWTLDARDVTYRASNNSLYLLARASNSTSSYLIVLNIDVATGNLNWNAVYAPANPTWGVQPQKLMHHTTLDSIMVVGYVNNGSNDDGFIFGCSSNTAWYGQFYYYGTAGQDRLMGISQGNAANPWSGGYFVTGNTNTGGNQDAWAMHVPDNSYLPTWNYRYDFNGENRDNHGTDVAERYSSAVPDHQIYISGYRTNSAGNLDMNFLKLSSAGIPITERAIGSGAAESSLFIDFDEVGTSNAALMMFGSSNDASGNGNWDMSMVRSYFNLEVPCSDYPGTPPAPPAGPPYLSNDFVFFTSPFVRLSAHMAISTTFNGIRCAGFGTDPNGNNSKMAQPGLSLSGHASLGSLEVNLTSMEAAPVKLSLTSMSGQVLLAQSVEASLGDSHFSLEMGSLPAGIYLLTATTGTEQVTKKIIVQ